MTQTPQVCSLTRFCFSLLTLRLSLWGGSPVGFCTRYGSVSGWQPRGFLYTLRLSLWGGSPVGFAHVTAQSLGWRPRGFLHTLQISLWGGSPVGFCMLRAGHIHTLT